MNHTTERQRSVRWGEIDEFITTGGDFNTLLPKLLEKIRKDVYDWYLLHPTTTKHTLLSSSHENTKTDHISGHKMQLHKLKRIEIIQRMLSDDNGIKQKKSVTER